MVLIPLEESDLAEPKIVFQIVMLDRPIGKLTRRRSLPGYETSRLTEVDPSELLEDGLWMLGILGIFHCQ